VGPAWGPGHLLLLAETLADHLIHGRFHNARAAAFAVPIALTVIGNEALIVLDSGADFVLANMDELSIFRHLDGTEADTIAVNLNEILAGKAKDPLIAPDDVIIVSMSTGKWLLQRFMGMPMILVI
jgi:hypothetical protein